MNRIHRILLILCFLVVGSIVLLVSCGTSGQEQFRPYCSNPDNLLHNASFEEGPSYWESRWSREEGTLRVDVKQSRSFRGHSSLYVRHRGSRDWSVSGNRTVSVESGEVYEIGGIIRSEEAAGRVELSVVTRDEAGEVMDWLFGIVYSSGEHDWKQVSGKFMIPKDCASIQARITGNGPATAYVDDVYLLRTRKAPDPFIPDTPVLEAEGYGTAIRYDAPNDLISLSFANGGRGYRLEGFTSSGVLTDATAGGNKLSASILGIESRPILVTFSIQRDGSIRCTVSGEGNLRNPFSAPGTLRPDIDQDWVIPQNEGLLIPADDPYFRPWSLDFGEGHGGLSMPFIGITDGSEGLMILSKTPDDIQGKYHAPDDDRGSLSGITFFWRPQMGKWGYSRTLEFRFVEEGGYVGIAKEYRRIAEEEGKLISLRQKGEDVPELDRLIGAANVWWWGNAEWWSNDPDAAEHAKELYEAGIDKVLWSHEADPETIKLLNDLGYVSGKYDIYQDVWAPDVPIEYGNRKGWPEDLVLLPDGTPMTGWVAKVDGKEYPGGVICSSRGYERLKREVPEELATHPYLARFIDTTTASPLRECYNPAHPVTRTQDREYKSKMLGFLSSELNLITGSETGIDWAAPYVHYFEGMMSLGAYRFEDAGYDLTTYKKPTEEMLRFQVGPYYRIPLFELVYHDSVVSYWYWGDASNRNPELMRDRDLFNLLYGTGPLYILDPRRWKETKEDILESYRTATLTSRRCGYEELVDHRFLNDAHTLQYSRFSDGTEVWVNFSDEKLRVPDRGSIGPKGYIISP